VGARYSAPVHTGPGAHPTSCLVPEESGRVVALTTHPYLAPKLKKKKTVNYTFIPPLGLHDLF